MSLCAKCGTEVASGVAFCPNCGARQTEELGRYPSDREYAGFWVRVVGHSIDLVVIFVLSLGVAFGVEALAAAGAGPSPVSEHWVYSAVAYVNVFGYFWYFNARGQTLGQRAMRIELIDENGDPPGVGRALWRVIASLLSGLLLGGIGHFVAAVDSQKRTVHDRLALTWAVRVRSR
jgi:uncharacterized RDD family membrane protein YckC